MPAPKNPKGAKSDKEWRDAIRLAVNEYRDDEDKAKGVKKLRRLAAALVDEGMGGNVVALKEIGDRLDGKPAQPVSNDEDNPFEVQLIRRVVVDDAGD